MCLGMGSDKSWENGFSLSQAIEYLELFIQEWEFPPFLLLLCRSCLGRHIVEISRVQHPCPVRTILSLGSPGCFICVPGGAEHPLALYPLHSDQLWNSVVTSIVWGEGGKPL